MDSVRYAKLIGILCIIAVISAVYSGIAAVAVMLFGALPAAVICRRKMNRDESQAQELLQDRQADCAFRGKCFEGTDGIEEGGEYTIFFSPRSVLICHEDRDVRKIPASELKDVRICTLEEVLDIAESGRRVSLGRLGDKMYLSADEQRRNLRKARDVRYLIIRGEREKEKLFCISFCASSEYAEYNRIVSKKQDPGEYVRNYGNTGR